MKSLFRIVLTLSSFLPAIIIFGVCNDLWLIPRIPNYLTFAIYMLLAFAFSCITLKVVKKFENTVIKKEDVTFIEVVNDSFITVYISYFFILLVTTKPEIFFCLFILFLVLVHHFKFSCFNIFYLIMRYNFYYITIKNRARILVITKKELKSSANIGVDLNLKRVNNFTFIEV
jgi:hypothetical protein